MKFIKIIFLLIFCLGLGFSSAYAEEYDYEIVTSLLSPWAMENEVGIFPEITIEIERRIGSNKVPNIIPWSRAQHYAKTHDSYIIFPLTRMPYREDKYKWIAPIIPVKIIFAAKGDKAVDIESAKNLRLILADQDSPAEAILKKNGYTNFEAIPVGRQLIPKMLQMDRADGWFAPAVTIDYLLRDTPLIDQFTFGPPAYENNLYLAASKSFPDEIIEKYQKAFQAMVADGTYRKIVEKYLGKLTDDYLLH